MREQLNKVQSAGKCRCADETKGKLWIIDEENADV